MHNSPVIKSALFVDFDNIYIGLKRSYPEAAEKFAYNPERWISWLEDKAYTGDFKRRILVRRCYLNPSAFNKFRPFFLRAAFEVVDCPPLTSTGKTSADMLMALDLIDAMQHPTHFDEFILFSGDTDFRPILLRLRQHDRRTSVLSVGATSPAYRASTDLLISEETFVEQGLGITETPVQKSVPRPSGEATPKIIAQMAKKVHETASMTGFIEAWNLPRVYKEFREFIESDSWLGYNSLKNLTEAVVATHDGLTLTEDEDWRVEVDTLDAETAPGTTFEAQPEVVTAFVRAFVRDAPQPVPLATMAFKLAEEFGDGIRDNDWQSSGSFRGYLQRLNIDPVEINPMMSGLLFIPSLHADAKILAEVQDTFAKENPELSKFARTVSDITDTPYWPPDTYAVVLNEIAQEINNNGFHLSQTSKAVRDRCNGKGLSVGRSDISFLLKGLGYSGYEFNPGSETASALGHQVVSNTIELAHRAQMDLDEEGEAKIEEWILGGEAMGKDTDTSDSTAATASKAS